MHLQAERETLFEGSVKKRRSGFAALRDLPTKFYGALLLVVLIIFGTTLILSSAGSAGSVSNANANVVIVECIDCEVIFVHLYLLGHVCWQSVDHLYTVDCTI